MAAEPECPFVSRGGLKLRALLDATGLAVGGLVCADLGCSTGGFTDCLLRAGAARVHAVDTAYGELAWTLRQDARVVVHERRNALHLEPAERVDGVVVDLGWTKQARAVPAALGWLKGVEESPDAWVATLIKPHYEVGEHRMADEDARAVCAEVVAAMPGLGVRVEAVVDSPVRGGKGKNFEAMALLRRA